MFMSLKVNYSKEYLQNKDIQIWNQKKINNLSRLNYRLNI
jgi:hypothetical protein